MNEWFCLTVAPRREFEAADSLARHSLATYVPLERSWARPNRYTKRRELRARVRFPGYVLLQANGALPRWHKVLAARYVRSVISVESEPVKARTAEIEELIRREKRGEFTAWKGERNMRTGQHYREGDAVNIVTGPLSGQSGEVERLGEETAFVRLDMLGARRLVEIGLEHLEAAE